jgi:uncharacterized protein with ACT and thioredoxin-like domain
LDKCGINFNVEDVFSEEQYLVEIDFYEVSGINPVHTISQGNKNFKAVCDISSNSDYEGLAKCYEKRLYVLGDKQYLLNVLTIVAKGEKNVR